MHWGVGNLYGREDSPQSMFVVQDQGETTELTRATESMKIITSLEKMLTIFPQAATIFKKLTHEFNN